MTPAARVQTAIELLDAVIAAARGNGPPADRLLAEGFRQRRYAGSKDRRAIRELVYSAIRACGPIPRDGRSAMLKLAQDEPSILPLFDGTPYAPAPVDAGETPAEGGLAPVWLEAALVESGIEGEEAAALLDRAPLDLRVNTLKTTREALQLPVPAEALPVADALRLPPGTPVDQWDTYRQGLIELQDLGSQIACMAVAAQPGQTVIDLCAGAGGKTLALAAAMQNSGKLVACDSDRARLSQLAPRAERAGALVHETILLDPGREMAVLGHFEGQADAVLVDAPCSGAGTWRRNPENRWRLNETQLARYVETQARLLEIGAQLVQIGGKLVFVTCSLLDAEGARQIDRFLQYHPKWRAERPDLPAGRERGQGIRLTPAHDGTDGFFIAQLVRVC